MTEKTNKELQEEIEILKEGISDEIDNLREELKKVNKKGDFLESQANDYKRVFDDDRKIFKDQQKEIEELKYKLSQK